MSTVYIAQNKEVAARKLGDELMIMSARDSTLFSLNATASAIWQAADGRTPLAEIVEQQVCKSFEVDPAVALTDAEELVQGLSQHGILKVSNTPIEEGP